MGSEDLELDAAIRDYAFSWLDRKTRGGHEALTWQDILAFSQENPYGVALALRPQGIFKPRVMSAALSIKTKPEEARTDRKFVYDDGTPIDGIARYKEQATNQTHNGWLHKAHELRMPLVYFRGITQGQYRAIYPTYVVGYDAAQGDFLLDVSQTWTPGSPVDIGFAPNAVEIATRHTKRMIMSRDHQEDFRAIVLAAYGTRCAVCELRHGSLLDAAHVIPDSDGGRAAVNNGLAMCKIHHAAYDANIMGISPDYRIHIRRDILEEVDGPMLRHGLQGHEGQSLRVLPTPRKWQPRRDYVEARFDTFKDAAPVG
ncbi:MULTISPECIES: HNH endonuclease [unclassified Nesterenkonia]|uniref:HNH endonuclease n=1 Tax=unclassified Nesterenkonia TaxID=2629769 RepID=UPI00087330DC|nr:MULTISPECIES: HNH endonuclease [unclassified Nesterenkonia]MDS2171163.1 HNH endonuclease [Nesterenkonia sp. CL21]OSM43074.1 hypothetical protein BCY76_010585 [Nesterenkonia sp. PF2B19]